MKPLKLELVSFKLCPYVQRSVITLLRKKVPFDITYIDLENPPAWFDAISPLGKVPVLKVFTGPGEKGEKDFRVLFESAVINEYVDEISPPSLHPAEALDKAFERAWIEFGSNLLGLQYALFTESDRGVIADTRRELFEDLLRVEDQVRGPFFRGDVFGLVDSSWAPLFTRLLLSPEIASAPEWKKMPKTRAWAEKLCADPAVRDSVVPTFAQEFADYCRAEGSPLFGP